MSGKTEEDKKAEFDRLYALLASLAKPNGSSDEKKLQQTVSPSVSTAPEPIVEEASLKTNDVIIPLSSKKNTPRAWKRYDPNMIHVVVEEKDITDVNVNYYKKVLLPDSMKKTYSKERTQNPNSIRCEACMRVYRNQTLYLQHFETSASCTTIVVDKEKKNLPFINRPIHVLVDDWLSMTISGGKQNMTCSFCKASFSTRGNLHKHFYTSVACNRMAFYAFKKVVLRETQEE